MRDHNDVIEFNCCNDLLTQDSTTPLKIQVRSNKSLSPGISIYKIQSGVQTAKYQVRLAMINSNNNYENSNHNNHHQYHHRSIWYRRKKFTRLLYYTVQAYCRTDVSLQIVRFFKEKNWLPKEGDLAVYCPRKTIISLILLPPLPLPLLLMMIIIIL